MRSYKAFYKTKAWKKTRQAYFDSQKGLCERCLRLGKYVPGEIVHHIVHLNAETVNNPDIALDFSNLELVCRKCHAELHPEIYQPKNPVPKPYMFDVNGNLVKNDEERPE